MFHSTKQENGQKSVGKSRALVVSLAFHIVAALLLFTLRFPEIQSAAVPVVFRIMLQTPAPLSPKLPPGIISALPALPAQPARAFSLPVPATTRAEALADLPAAPLLESPPSPSPALPNPEFAKLAPPPLKLDNLMPALPLQTRTKASVGRIEDAGFSQAPLAPGNGKAQADKGTSEGLLTGAFSATMPSSLAATARRLAPAGAFGEASAARAERPAPAGTAIMSKPIEILSKPLPTYTDEARRLSIEGEVLVEMTFTANGEIKILRMVKGLGHGLDESALAAAGAIRFRPAQQQGVPVDFTAIVHILFQLA